MTNRDQSAGHIKTSDGQSTQPKGKSPMEELPGNVRGAGGRFHAGSTRVPKKKAEGAGPKTRDEWRDRMMDKSY